MTQKVKIPKVLSWLKTREVKVRNHGFYIVPKHINRVDPREGNWGGWQIRIKQGSRYFSKFFSDSAFDRKKHIGTPSESLQAALDYLATMELVPYVKQYPNMPSRRNPGMVGIRLKSIRKKGRHLEQIYLEVSAIEKNAAAKRVYVSTENTFSAEKLKAAFAKAVDIREALKKSVLDKRLQSHQALIAQLRNEPE